MKIISDKDKEEENEKNKKTGHIVGSNFLNDNI
jgi:hypothetical protein